MVTVAVVTVVIQLVNMIMVATVVLVVIGHRCMMTVAIVNVMVTIAVESVNMVTVAIESFNMVTIAMLMDKLNDRMTVIYSKNFSIK